MSRIERIQTLPSNYSQFIDEIAAGFESLYGPAASAEYRATAPRATARTLQHEQIIVLAQLDGAAATGVLFGTNRERFGQITFIHVLKEYEGTGVEQALVQRAVEVLRSQQVDAITAECIPFCAVDLEDTYYDLAFQRVDRQLMSASLDEDGLVGKAPPISEPCTDSDAADIAEVLADAYIGHPERALHVEMSDPTLAEVFTRNAIQGGYGAAHPQYTRFIRDQDVPVAALLGCRVAPGLGFVLQLAVRRSHQGRGLGTRLLQETAAAFHERGLEHVSLGVTQSSMARVLYERLGFRRLREVQAYSWWRDGIRP
jgi:ribosomal protein S18 acetylase RimI-like enzyme